MSTRRRFGSTVAVALLSALSLGLAFGAARPGLADCTSLYTADGWVITQCSSDPNVPATMEVVLDGVVHGQAALVRIAHQSEASAGVPEVVVLYASGYVRLKQNADPSPALPFGSSFILGPAYWSNASTYHHNPQLQQLTIDTAWLPNGPLRMHASGTNGAFTTAYDLDLPPPRDRQTRMHVTQTFTASAAITIDATRHAEHQGLKLAQVSSMSIAPSLTCDGGRTGCHDSNMIRLLNTDGARTQVAFANQATSGFILPTPAVLGSTWLDVLHSDDVSWQGNTPNVRIALDVLPTDRTISAQGWLEASTNPDNDNIGVWLHDDGAASLAWQAGQQAQIGYWLLAQDNPPDPWGDLELRPGQPLLDFAGAADCAPVAPDASVSATVSSIAGYADPALQLNYNLGSANGSWAQVRCDFDPPLNLADYDHLRIAWRGSAQGSNSLQVGLINPTNTGERIFARSYHHAAHRSWWGDLVVPFAFLEAWSVGTSFDPSQVSAIFLSVVKDPQDDSGGAGSLAIDEIGAFNVAARDVPTAFSQITHHPHAATAAANWLADQQQPGGLLKSWEGDTDCQAHTYDQALALIVFSAEGMWPQADALATALVAIQEDDGSWFKIHNCDTGAAMGTPPEKWEGDIAWATFALSRYLNQRGARANVTTARDHAADWLAGRINTDGCLLIDHTEGTIDAWLALDAAGRTSNADRLKNCLLRSYWDEPMGRFKGGRSRMQPYLDNQTWGAAFLTAIGEPDQARRALSYAAAVLSVPAQGGQLFGLDGQGGPWAVWNEGSAQYIAAGGTGAEEFLRELLAQQRADGAMSGAPDDFSGAGIWTTRSAGVAPTAWLYNALTCAPFPPAARAGCTVVMLPLAEQTLTYRGFILKRMGRSLSLRYNTAT